LFQTANKTDKVSDKIIDQIRDVILSGQLKPGDKLASERELLTQFGVSKGTLREALRVLEVMGLIEMRKGTSGGAFVAEVDMRTTIHNLITFLHLQKVSVKEITMLRYLIEPTVAQIAATRITEKDIFNLKKIIGRTITSGTHEVTKEIGFHRYLARMAGNTLLAVLVDFVDDLLRGLKSELNLGQDFYREVRKSHRLILECMIQKDPVASRVAMANDLIAVGKYMAQATKTEPFDPLEFPQIWDGNQWHQLLNPGARVVAEGDPLMKNRGVILKRVGTSPLYLASQSPTGITKRSL
jgi:GntR family transcriptional repressor for pyruvate dehydrogenase complex